MMRKPQVVVLGLGRLGRACVESLLKADDLQLAGVVRRPEHGLAPGGRGFADVPAFTHWSEIPRIDVALLCLPSDLVSAAAHELLQHHKPIVECAEHHGEAFERHRARIHQIAVRHRTPAIVGAGWDPGALSLLRHLFGLLTPKGHTETTNRPGVSLHHSASVRSIAGVKDALCTEVRSAKGGLQRYVYVEFDRAADQAAIADLIRNDPLFLDAETLVLPVDNVAALEDEGHGIVLERWGAAGGAGHQLLLLEARFDRWALAAQMMVAAARAIVGRAPGAASLLDIPLAALAPVKSRAVGLQEV
jgi:diaminopimelate dehydrogenase